MDQLSSPTVMILDKPELIGHIPHRMVSVRFQQPHRMFIFPQNQLWVSTLTLLRRVCRVVGVKNISTGSGKFRESYPIPFALRVSALGLD
jgi:hypothetical protein